MRSEVCLKYPGACWGEAEAGSNGVRVSASRDAVRPYGRVSRPWAAIWVSLATELMNVQLAPADAASDAGLALHVLTELGFKFARCRPAPSRSPTAPLAHRSPLRWETLSSRCVCAPISRLSTGSCGRWSSQWSVFYDPIDALPFGDVDLWEEHSLSILEGELYTPLQDLNLFNAVVVDREAHTLVWPNGADFDPAILHDWPEHEASMIALAQRWAAAARGEK